jgi:nucleoside-diphosphate-sugar epimerase
MKRVLVTGARGFIGRHTLQPLLDLEYEVHAVSKNSEEQSEKINYHQCDLLSEDATSKLIKEIKPTHLLHFAWYVEPGKFWKSEENFRWQKASEYLFRVFSECGGRNAVFAGTCAEYDWNSEHMLETETPLNPRTLYGECKNNLRIQLEDISKQFNNTLAWGRIFFLYGPHEARKRLVSEVICKLLQAEEARCTHGNEIRDFMHVLDVAKAFIRVLESNWSGAVNIASGKPTTIQNVVTTIGEIIGRSELIKFGAYPASPNDPEKLTADVSILTKKIEFSSDFDLKSGLEDAVEWWRKRRR